MRSFVGFLLLEDLLDHLPTTSSVFTGFAAYLFNPTVTIVETACATTLGRIQTIDYSIEGVIELATGLGLTQSRLNTLLSNGVYTVATRDLHSCVSKNGICQTCYRSSFPDYPIPLVGTQISLPSRYILNHDIFRANGVANIYTLTQAPTAYTTALVFLNGVLQLSSAYTISNQTLTLVATPALGIDVLVKYYVVSAKPFLNYLALGYGGSIMGLESLPTEPIIIRESLRKSLISDGQLNKRRDLLAAFPGVDPLYAAYADRIHDSLEKAIYMLCIYGIFTNVNTN